MLSPRRELASSFYRLKEGRVTCTGDLKSCPFLPESGENSCGSYCLALWSMAPGVVAILESPLTVPRTCPCPMASVIGMAAAAGRAVLTFGEAGRRGCYRWRPHPGQWPYCVRGSLSISVEGPAEEEVQGFDSIVVVRCQTCPHSAPQVHTVPGIMAQYPEQADGTPVTSAVRRGC